MNPRMTRNPTQGEVASDLGDRHQKPLPSDHSGLRFELLSTSDLFTLCRAHTADGQTWLAVAAHNEVPFARGSERLKRECRFANELDPDWALCPIGLIIYEERPTLLLEDPGGAPLDKILARKLDRSSDWSQALRLACELTYAVRRMHERGIIHKDITPKNVFVGQAGQIFLTGFGLATRSSIARLVPSSVEVVAGTFAYMAPEQTGRMNRSVDTRSDLYALGVTLYELFTGTLPFMAGDPMEWAHCHIARKPPPPHTRAESIPRAVDSIILKLLAKDPEDRYQTAKGAENDLRRCLTAWLVGGHIDDFRLGQDDISDRLFVPEKLYGRDAAIAPLIAAADQVIARGASELVLISGYSGIGKSSLVNELHRKLDPRHVLFASGKFDQYKRDIPYATLAQAFGGLARQLLTKSDKELAIWRDELCTALGQNGQLMIGLIPELAIIVGEQPAAPPVDLQSAQARFQLVFKSLLQVFSKPEHPLVLFIDDLQWLDTATLELLERVITDAELRHLLLIGAYRDNEVGETHPLTRTLEAMRRARSSITEVRLLPLNPGDLANLLSDTLGESARDVTALAELVGEKTAGNPFFSVQFVRELASEALLTFEPNSLKWVWDLAGIRSKDITDNVAHLIAAKLDRLPQRSREVLGQLALLGSAADVETLSLVYNNSPDETHATLRSAVDAGLVRYANGAFAFVHDHVQEAAYALLPEKERSQLHLRLGRLLLSQTPQPEVVANIFEIVSQFDRGFSSISSPPELEQVANLYLTAGRRAKTAGAFAAAYSYFSRGRQLLGDDNWASRCSLAYQLELNQAECEIVAGKFDMAEARLTLLGLNSHVLTDRAGIVCLAILLHFTLGRSDRAVEVGLDFLSSAGISWPERPSEVDVRLEYDEMHRCLQRRSIEALIDLPEMDDLTTVAVMAVLTELFPAAYAIDRNLMEFVLLRMVTLSLQHGNCGSSSVAYSALNMAIGSRFADYETISALGHLALKLVNRRESDRYKARVYSCFAAFTMPWIAHISLTLPLTTQAFKIGSSMGDMAFAAYNSRNQITHLLMSGAPLGQVQHEVESAIASAKNVQLGLPVERFFGQLSLIQMLRAGSTYHAQDGDSWALQGVDGPPGLSMIVCYHWVFRLQEHYFAGDYYTALRAAAHLESGLWAMRSSIEEAEYELFRGLAEAAASTNATSEERRHHVAALSKRCGRFAIWAQHSPENFGCRRALLDAELARLQGHERDAQDLYEEAARLARMNGFVQVEALANELAGRFYASLSLTSISDAYLRNAYDCYERWGCLIKIRQLDLRYPHLRRRRSGLAVTAVDIPLASLDVQVVDRASKTLSSEMDLTNLIEKLMRLAVEHAGAERGLLLLLDGNEMKIEAEITTEAGSFEVLVLKRTPTKADLPQTAVQYVLRNQTPFILEDGVAADSDYIDDYFLKSRPRSILCLPIVKTADVIGVLYLEHSMTTRAFTPGRVAVLDFLASQAAIWLDNARLYSDLQRSEAWLREAQHLSRTGSFYWHVPTGNLEFSEQMYRICQIDPGKSMAVHLLESRVHSGDAGAFHEMIETARTTGTDLNYKFRLQMADLSVKHVHLVAHSGRARNGELRYIGAIQDVTSQNLAQEALSKARSELARVARITTLGVLTASIAHEVNQPLLGIVTNATTCLRMLAANPPNIEGARKTAQRSVRDGHRAADMIRRLRGLFGNSGTVSEPVDMNDAAREVISLVMNELESNHVILETRLVQEMPRVRADRIQIQQVIMNLLLNASDAMREIVDPPRKLILSTRLTKDGSICLDVRDCGAGFDAQTADRLFEAFYTTKAGGMGMGLSISRSIIEANGGLVWASLNGDAPGATFSFSLPIETARSAAGEALSSANGRNDDVSDIPPGSQQ